MPLKVGHGAFSYSPAKDSRCSFSPLARGVAASNTRIQGGHLSTALRAGSGPPLEMIRPWPGASFLRLVVCNLDELLGCIVVLVWHDDFDAADRRLRFLRDGPGIIQGDLDELYVPVLDQVEGQVLRPLVPGLAPGGGELPVYQLPLADLVAVHAGAGCGEGGGGGREGSRIRGG